MCSRSLMCLTLPILRPSHTEEHGMHQQSTGLSSPSTHCRAVLVKVEEASEKSYVGACYFTETMAVWGVSSIGSGDASAGSPTLF